jgi:hypothetical protein
MRSLRRAGRLPHAWPRLTYDDPQRQRGIVLLDCFGCFLHNSDRRLLGNQGLRFPTVGHGRFLPVPRWYGRATVLSLHAGRRVLGTPRVRLYHCCFCSADQLSYWPHRPLRIDVVLCQAHTCCSRDRTERQAALNRRCQGVLRGRPTNAPCNCQDIRMDLKQTYSRSRAS